MRFFQCYKSLWHSLGGEAGAMERGLRRGTWVAILQMSTHHYISKVLNVQVLVPLH